MLYYLSNVHLVSEANLAANAEWWSQELPPVAGFAKWLPHQDDMLIVKPVQREKTRLDDQTHGENRIERSSVGTRGGISLAPEIV